MDELTQRENQVFRLIMAEKQNKEIASALFISVRTARLHTASILRKLRCATRYEIQKKYRQPSFNELLVIADLSDRVRRLEEALGIGPRKQ